MKDVWDDRMIRHVSINLTNKTRTILDVQSISITKQSMITIFADHQTIFVNVSDYNSVNNTLLLKKDNFMKELTHLLLHVLINIFFYGWYSFTFVYGKILHLKSQFSFVPV